MGQSEEQGKREVGGGASINITIESAEYLDKIVKELENSTYTVIYEGDNMGFEFTCKKDQLKEIDGKIVMDNIHIKRCWTK